MKKGSKYDNISNDGLISLAIAIIAQARKEYEDLIFYGQGLEARRRAKTDSKGLVGYIAAWATNDNEYLLKEVMEKTKDF